MSKRFGRNQKRAFRKQVGEMEQFITQAKRTQERLIRQGRDNAECVERVARLLGESFIGLKPVQRYVEDLNRNYRQPLLRDLSAIAAYEPGALCRIVDMAMDSVEFEPMTVKGFVDDMRRSIHFDLRTPDGKLTYGISREGYEHMRRDKEYMRRKICEMVSYEFASHIERGVR